MMKSQRLIAMVTVICLVLGSSASAVIRRVDVTRSPGGNGSSWAQAYNSLATALSQASSGDEIWVAAGTYFPGTSRTSSFAMIAGVELYGGFLGVNHPTLPNGETLRSQRNFAANVCVLSGEIGTGAVSDNSYTVVKDETGGNTARLDGFTVTGGFEGDPLYDAGAGIFLDDDSGLRIANCRIVSNSASTNGLGGGMYCGSGCAPLIQDTVFEANTAAAGGAIFFTDSGSGQYQVERCLFVGNSATHPTNDGGGAIWNGSNFVCTITHSSFVANFGAGSNGGGGAIVNWNLVSQGGDLRMVNCLFLDNETDYDGGAIWTSGTGRIAMTNCTVGANTALSMGGGLFDPGKVSTLTNCIFWANTDGGTDVEAAQMTWFTYSSKVINNCCVEGWTGDLDPDGVDNFGTDPKFVNLAGDNLRLLCNSSCLDNGDNSAISGVSTDLDGGTRIVNMVVDRGAYERAICALAGDLDGNSVVNGLDIRPFKDCVLASSPNCPCADFNLNGIADVGDIDLFACRLVTDQAC